MNAGIATAAPWITPPDDHLALDHVRRRIVEQLRLGRVPRDREFDRSLHVIDVASRVDERVELSRERFARDVAVIEALLADARIGTHVVTSNGYGAELPAGWALLKVDRAMPAVLRLARKER